MRIGAGDGLSVTTGPSLRRRVERHEQIAGVDAIADGEADLARPPTRTAR